MPEAGKNMVKRVVSFLLHAHLPYGIRADLETSLEQAWLCETVTDCYLPLLQMIGRLPQREDAPWLTLSLSPTLLELWSHPEFPDRYRQHLRDGGDIIEGEMANLRHPAQRRELAARLRSQWLDAGRRFDAIDGDIGRAFAEHAKSGRIELITTAATHAFLPAHQANPAFRAFQVENGLNTFLRHTGIHPKGFWLPECGYFPGLEEDLTPYGIRYFGLEQTGLTAAKPPATVRAPLKCPNGVFALGRDADLSQKVWNARIGYPGHEVYREFHHDGIHDLNTDMCGAFALPNGKRLPLGLKYWRVTGSPEKDWYAPEAAGDRAKLDASDFVSALAEIEAGPGEPSLVFLPFDAELFGHWWYEGPQWLESVLAQAHEQEGTSVQSAATALEYYREPATGRPAASTWGRNGDYSFWINRETDWLYPLLQDASSALGKLVRDHVKAPEKSLERRALLQAARELLLAGASDWPFMLRAGTTNDYAMQRLREHIGRFYFLQRSLEKGPLEEKYIQLLEQVDPPFDHLLLNAYHTPASRI